MIPSIPGINTGGGGLSLNQDLSDKINTASHFNIGGNAGFVSSASAGWVLPLTVIIIAIVILLWVRKS